MKTALVCGAGGFIGGHMAKRLKEEGYWVRGVDLVPNEFMNMEEVCDEFFIGDLRDTALVSRMVFGPNQRSEADKENSLDVIYQLAADMGGAGFVFTGENDADIMHNSAMINLNIVHEAVKKSVKKVFYSSSACMYPEHNQLDPDNPNCVEDSAYPAAPDSEYGWEKLFSERLYFAFAKNYGLNVRVTRYHNIFGPQGTWTGGREKAPAAFCRKVAMAEDGGSIEVWGDGSRTRSFLYIDECIEATRRFVDSDFQGPVNIGSEEMITIQNFAKMAIDIPGKNLSIENIDGPLGVHGRNSDNNLYREKMGWEPTQSLREGMEKTYAWILQQVKESE
jgi:nucleoside-diphosphate-sugar epimerase